MSDQIMQTLDEIEVAARAIGDSPYMVRVNPSAVLTLVAALRAVLELTNEAEEDYRAAGPWTQRQDGAAALAGYIEQAIEEALGVDDV